MACCGRKAGETVEYKVTAKNGQTTTTSTIAEAKLFLATNGGGSYKAQAK